MFLSQLLQLKEIVGSSEMLITTNPEDIRQIPRSFCLNAFHSFLVQIVTPKILLKFITLT